jgi:hypothetical protein
VKDYPLIIEPLYELESGGHPLEYYSKGHHCADVFYAALCVYLDVAAWVAPAATRHTHYRVVPMGDLKWAMECQPGRGAFPVTVMEVL